MNQQPTNNPGKSESTRRHAKRSVGAQRLLSLPPGPANPKEERFEPNHHAVRFDEPFADVTPSDNAWDIPPVSVGIGANTSSQHGLAVHPPSSKQAQASDDDPTENLCVFLRASAWQDLHKEITAEDVEAFMRDEAGKVELPEKTRAKLTALPAQLPNAKERLDAYYQQNDVLRPLMPTELPKRCEGDLRAALPWGDTICRGREQEISEALLHLNQSGCPVLLVVGAAGIGKTTFAQAIAQRITKLDTFAGSIEPECVNDILVPANIRFLDCAGLSNPVELSSLLLTQISDSPLTMLPEAAEDRIEVFVRRLNAHLSSTQGSLWILDGLDDCLRATQDDTVHEGHLTRMMEICARAATPLKLIVTARRETEPGLLHKLFGTPLVRVQRLQPLSDASCLDAFLEQSRPHLRQVSQFQRHPLAWRLSEAAFAWRQRQPAQQLLDLFEDADTILEEAGQYAWDQLDETDQTLLRFCLHLPAGIWCLHDRANSARNDYVRWHKVFEAADWKKRLARLYTLEWVTVQNDDSDPLGSGCIYRLRPALRSFVQAQTSPVQAHAIERRLVYFWAFNLKQWSRAVAGRLTHRVEARLPAGADKRTQLLAEESARYLIDINRLNWQHAYGQITRCAAARDVSTLYYLYLRGATAYCRMTGLLYLFETLAHSGLQSLAAVPDQPSPLNWRKVVQAVCHAACHGMMGRTQRRLGKWAAAQGSLQQALAILCTLPPEKVFVRHELAWSLTEQGRLDHVSGRWQKAEEPLRQALGLREALVGHFERQPIGGTHGEWPESHPLERKKTEHLRSLASTLNTYGNLLNERFAYAEAEKTHRRALAIRQQVEAGPSVYSQRYLAHCYNDLGNSLFYQGHFKAALAQYQAALKIREALVPHAKGGLGQYVARTCNNLGNTLRKLGRWTEAQVYLERAVSIYHACVQEFPSRFNELLARTLTNLGRVYYHQGRLREARRSLEEADRIHAAAAARGMVAPFHWVETCNFLSIVYLAFDATSHAELALRRAEKLLAQGAPICALNHAWYLAFTLNTRARQLLNSPARGDWERAEALLRECECLRLELDRKVNIRHATSLHFAQHWHDLGLVLRRLGDRDEEARGYFADALDLRRQLAQNNPGYMLRLVARTTMQLALIHEEAGQTQEAERLYREARTIFFKLTRTHAPGFKQELYGAHEALKRSLQTTRRQAAAG